MVADEYKASSWWKVVTSAYLIFILFIRFVLRHKQNKPTGVAKTVISAFQTLW